MSVVVSSCHTKCPFTVPVMVPAISPPLVHVVGPSPGAHAVRAVPFWQPPASNGDAIFRVRVSLTRTPDVVTRRSAPRPAGGARPGATARPGSAGAASRLGRRSRGDHHGGGRAPPHRRDRGGLDARA